MQVGLGFIYTHVPPLFPLKANTPAVVDDGPLMAQHVGILYVNGSTVKFREALNVGEFPVFTVRRARGRR